MPPRRQRTKRTPKGNSGTSGKASAQPVQAADTKESSPSEETTKRPETTTKGVATNAENNTRRKLRSSRPGSDAGGSSMPHSESSKDAGQRQKSTKRRFNQVEEDEEIEEESALPTKKRKSGHLGDHTHAAEPPRRPLRNEEYTVGWISALEVEHTAAQMALDEEHGQPDSVSQNDNNSYVLGKICNHNVVLAVLPMGEYGLASAAQVARDMRHSFPNVRIGLMVGIGGGAPTAKQDVRLGDIVVGIGFAGRDAVFQYDYGKAIQGQDFLPTSSLNQPPIALRAGVASLKSDHGLRPHRLGEYFRDLLQKFPHLHETYDKPDTLTDRLYKSRCVHKDGQEDCSLCGNDPDNVVTRKPREGVKVHYGAIASANTLMKDALIRDKLAESNKILCFEMEAAGLVQHFPCLVIRGICDYADSHKNKQWQGFAALAAAAYTKYLLKFIHRDRVEAERAIGEILSGVVKAVNTLQEIQTAEVQDRKHKALLEWFSKIDSVQQQEYFIKQAVRGTGTWLFETEQFNTWFASPGQTIFCQGPAGAGKTTLMAILIEGLEDEFVDEPDVGIAHIYFGYRPAPTDDKELYATLFRQLAPSWSDLPEKVKDTYHYAHGASARSQCEEALSLVIREYSRVFIVLDALDECEIKPGLLERFLEFISDLQKSFGINLVATSRYHSRFAEIFRDSSQLMVRATDEDVKRYLNHRLDELGPNDPIRKRDKLRQEVDRRIQASVDGM
ncbi:hypothetical protein ACHAPJ_013251 [Fusarium lateritium]